MRYARPMLGILLLIAAMASADASAREQPAPSEPGSASGHSLFISKGCYECHGYMGRGAMGVGAELSPVSLSINVFTRYVRHPSGAMPPYSEKLLPDGDLNSIYAYLRTLPKPATADHIPLLAPYVEQGPK